MSKVFLDTNILVYALAAKTAAKQKLARKWLRELSGAQQAVISTQVLQEFYVVATGKMKVEPFLAKNILHSLSNMETITITPALIESAIDTCILHRISFWDALILASAESAKCDAVWSEDLSHGEVIRGVKIVDPFRAGK